MSEEFYCSGCQKQVMLESEEAIEDFYFYRLCQECHNESLEIVEENYEKEEERQAIGEEAEEAYDQDPGFEDLGGVEGWEDDGDYY